VRFVPLQKVSPHRQVLLRVDIVRMVAIVSAVILISPISEASLLDLPIVSRFDREMKCYK
jgi:hypothetical protein